MLIIINKVPYSKIPIITTLLLLTPKTMSQNPTNARHTNNLNNNKFIWHNPKKDNSTVHMLTIIMITMKMLTVQIKESVVYPIRYTPVLTWTVEIIWVIKINITMEHLFEIWTPEYKEADMMKRNSRVKCSKDQDHQIEMRVLPKELTIGL